MDPIILPRISDQKPLISVISITYNHEPYIRSCLEGFLMQETDFPMEIIVHDDASTDHTADILREYYEKRPDLFHIIIERENQYSQRIAIMPPLYQMARGKYLAICEGDDCWIDPLKLKKQVHALENHKEIGLCGTNVKIINEKNEDITRKKNRREGKYTTKQIMKSNPFYTCSLAFRKDLFEEWNEIRATINTKKWLMGDYPKIIFFSSKSDCVILKDVCCCYRVLKKSASHGNFEHRLSFILSSTHIKLQLNKRLGLDIPDRIILQWCVVTLVKAWIISKEKNKRNTKKVFRLVKRIIFHKSI